MHPVFVAEAHHGERPGRRIGIGEREREQELVPRGDEHEHAGGDDAAGAERHHDLGENLPIRASVDDRRLANFAGHVTKEAAQQPDRERKVEGRIKQDQDAMGVEHAEPRGREIDRNEDRDARNHPGDQDRQQEAGAANRQMRQRVAGRHRDRQHGAGRRQRHHDAVEDVALESAVGEHAAEACQRRGEQEADRERIGGGPKAGHHHPDIGEEIDHADRQTGEAEDGLPDQCARFERHGRPRDVLKRWISSGDVAARTMHTKIQAMAVVRPMSKAEKAIL